MSDDPTQWARLAEAIPRDRLIALHFANGAILPGRVEVLTHGWVRLRTRDSEQLVNLAHVAAIDLNQGQTDPGPLVQEGLPKPRSKDVPFKVGNKVPARPWTDADLKALSEGFLDGALDPELAERHHRTRGQIRDLRQGFECNRGNLIDDQISPAAATWVQRWHRVLGANRTGD